MNANGLDGSSIIITPRLALRRMDREFLRATRDGDRLFCSAWLGASVPDEWYLEQAFAALRAQQLVEEPDYLPWAPRAVVLRRNAGMVGFIGFHSAPNPPYLQRWAPGGIEFGYTVFEAHRRQGIAEEAVRGLMNWARSTRAISSFVVSIAPSNRASLALATKLGFSAVGEHQDPVDGLETILVMAEGIEAARVE